MSNPEQNKTTLHETPDGYDVFHWPEFQALAKRLMIDVGAPVININLDIPLEGPVRITSETHGLDETKKK